jgi:hypothetical protein
MKYPQILALRSFTTSFIMVSKLDEQCITIEQYLDGDFRKYINNTGEIIVSDGSDLALKSEMFFHYTYIKSGKQLMVLVVLERDYPKRTTYKIDSINHNS